MYDSIKRTACAVAKVEKRMEKREVVGALALEGVAAVRTTAQLMLHHSQVINDLRLERAGCRIRGYPMRPAAKP